MGWMRVDSHQVLHGHKELLAIKALRSSISKGMLVAKMSLGWSQSVLMIQFFGPQSSSRVKDCKQDGGLIISFKPHEFSIRYMP